MIRSPKAWTLAKCAARSVAGNGCRRPGGRRRNRDRRCHREIPTVSTWLNPRDLPKLVALTPVGKDVAIVIVRRGHEMTKTVKLGRLEDGTQKASLTVGDDQGKKLPPALVEKAALRHGALEA